MAYTHKDIADFAREYNRLHRRYYHSYFNGGSDAEITARGNDIHKFTVFLKSHHLLSKVEDMARFVDRFPR